MTRSQTKRLGHVRHAIDASPVRRGILLEGYEWFTSFGELPDDLHVAYEVVQQALRGGEEARLDGEDAVAERVREARLAYHQRKRPSESWPPSVRALLFDEALFEPEPVRNVARAAIATEVAWGGDVENRAFAARHGIPGYGSVGMHVCGWPQKLAVAPYEDQGTRLIVRLDNARRRIPHDDPRWVDEYAKAVVAFRHSGELPDDDLSMEMLLVDVEMDQLRAHKRGKDVKQAMKLLDQAARGEGGAMEAALKRLCDMARAGQLR